MFFFCFFFFSSRRRHTRCGRDWSSDVCSSDLSLPKPNATLKLVYSSLMKVLAMLHIGLPYLIFIVLPAITTARFMPWLFSNCQSSSGVAHRAFNHEKSSVFNCSCCFTGKL